MVERIRTSLWTREADVEVVFVLIDNDGGGIFHMLPVREHEPHFTPYFATPHGLDFRHSAELFGLEGIVNQMVVVPEQGVTPDDLGRLMFGRPGVAAVESVRDVVKRRGLLSDIASAITQTGTNIQSAEMHSVEGGMNGAFVVEVQDLAGHTAKAAFVIDESPESEHVLELPYPAEMRR